MYIKLNNMKTKKTKNDLLEEVFGIPRETPDTWFDEQINHMSNKWDKLHKICEDLKLGTGDVYRDRSKGQMTKEYYDKQDSLLIDITRTHNSFERGYKSVWMSDGRDYFIFVEDSNDNHWWKDGEWVWKEGAKEIYDELVELNKLLKEHYISQIDFTL